jgi:hypothetical protein
MSNLLLNRIGVAGKKKIENIKNFSGSIIVDADRPWLGLASFTEDTQRFFFGRDTEIAEIFVRVRDNLLSPRFMASPAWASRHCSVPDCYRSSASSSFARCKSACAITTARRR